eukprot:scaffold48_cov311-Pinguiococcus_pyrenoidosus.AAC.316
MLSPSRRFGRLFGAAVTPRWSAGSPGAPVHVLSAREALRCVWHSRRKPCAPPPDAAPRFFRRTAPGDAGPDVRQDVVGARRGARARWLHAGRPRQAWVARRLTSLRCQMENTDVYVGNLTWDTTDEELVEFLAAAGEVGRSLQHERCRGAATDEGLLRDLWLNQVVSAAVQRHADSQRSKGWGYRPRGIASPPRILQPLRTNDHSRAANLIPLTLSERLHRLATYATSESAALAVSQLDQRELKVRPDAKLGNGRDDGAGADGGKSGSGSARGLDTSAKIRRTSEWEAHVRRGCLAGPAAPCPLRSLQDREHWRHQYFCGEHSLGNHERAAVRALLPFSARGCPRQDKHGRQVCVSLCSSGGWCRPPEETHASLLRGLPLRSRSRGFAIAKFPNQELADAAVAAMNGKELQGRQLQVGVFGSLSSLLSPLHESADRGRALTTLSQVREDKAPHERAVVAPRVYVGKLSTAVAEDDLISLFADVGTVTDVRMAR